jgi:S-DNA-T family DNA segregation ATPase FtsK/SpoIIIE
MVGAIGTAFGHFNRNFFGLIGFIYPFMMTIPAYLIYKDSRLSHELSKFMLLGALMFFSLLLFQAKLFDPPFQGAIGAMTNGFLQDFIGNFGIWLFIASTLVLSTVLMLNATFEDISDSLDVKSYYMILKEKINRFLFPEEPDFMDLDGESFYHERAEFDRNRLPKSIPTQTVAENHYHDNHEHDREDIGLEAISDISTLFEKKNAPSKTEIIDKDVPLPFTYEEEAEDPLSLLKKESKSLEEEVVSFTPPPVVETAPKPKATKQKPTTIVKELEENTKLLDKQIEKGKQSKPKNFKLPYLDFLKSVPKRKTSLVDESEIDQKIVDLLEKLRQFKIEGDVVRTYSGPVVTTFEFRPAAHIKVSKILTLQDDLAMALKAETIRIQAPIPGKDVVGIEIPNKEIETIYLKEILESKLFKSASSPLTLAVGKDIVGNPFITDLKKLPHLLIAGTTGSGKSVGVNAMLVSLLYRNSPDQLKLLMIDPKMLEFSIYNDIPHLLTPVITQPKKAIIALANMVAEMEKRYKLMSQTKTKNIENYNEKAKKEGREEFPYIVIIIDELADLMMTSGKDVEFYIARLAQMARASGIHIIVATQRPSVDVVTGLIKANLPSRISFKVGQKIDSKIILDAQGAESLLGRGDMLFTPPGSSSIIRLHAPFVTEEEIESIVEFLKVQREVVYDPSFLSEVDPDSGAVIGGGGGSGDFDELFEEAKNVVLTDKKTSISYLQRRLQIGYNRSATIVEQLEMAGVLSAPNAKGQREIL